MDEDFVEADEDNCPPASWRWTVLPLRGLTFTANVCEAAGSLFAGLAADVASHYNYEFERDRFAAEAGRELETILEASEED